MTLTKILSLAVAALLLVASCTPTPESKKAKHRERGLAYLEQQKYQEAIVEFRSMVQVDPQDAEAHYRLGLAYLKLGDFASLRPAFQELKRAVELDPKNLDAHLKLGQMYLLGRDAGKARESAEVVLASTPESAEGLALKGQSFITEKEYDKGLAELKKALQLDPKNVNLHLSLAKAYALKKDLPAIEKTLKDALAIAPESVEVRVALGDFHTLSGRQSEAEAEFKRAVELAPDDTAVYLKLGGYYRLVGRWSDARKVYEQLAARKPQDVQAQLILGEYLIYTRQPEPALTAFQQAVKANEKSVPARNRLIDFYLDLGKLETAEPMIKAILAKHPNDLSGQYFEARLRLARGNPDEAIPALQRVTKEEPRFALAHRYLGLAFQTAGQLAQARRELIEAVKLAPLQVDSRVELAALHLAEGSVDLALEQAQAAVGLNPFHAGAAIVLGEVYLRKGDKARARNVHEALVKALPKEPLGHFQLGVIDRAEKNKEAALAHFEQAL